MSTAIFPSLPIGWSVKRSPIWATRVPVAVSGKRTAIEDWSFPRWEWEVTYELLRQAGANQQMTQFSYSEFATMQGFFNNRFGRGDTFLYSEPDDNTSPTDQSIASGDGTTVTFQMQSSFGSFVQPIYAFNAITNIKVAGTVKTPITDYDVTTWGGTKFFAGGASTDAPGILRFVAAPASGAAITATFTFYFPCRFMEDKMTFEKFVSYVYNAKSVKFDSEK